jgi:hypothetical protein
VVSLAEDTLVVGIIALFITFPVIAAGVSAFIVVGLIIALYFLFKWARQVFGSVKNFLLRKPPPKRREQPVV